MDPQSAKVESYFLELLVQKVEKIIGDAKEYPCGSSPKTKTNKFLHSGYYQLELLILIKA